MNAAQQAPVYRTTMPPPPVPHQAPQHQVFQNQIVCSGCQTLLMYPQGASNVRCSRCHHITAVTQGGPEMAQLVCNGCRVLLMYPRGASSVQCSCCSTINGAVQPQSNQLGHVVCGGCTVTLMYALGAQSVKCALCNFVTGVPPPPSTVYQQAGGPSTSAPPAPAVKLVTNAVVVENPSTLDENGNEVPSISVGVQKLSS